MKWPEYLKQTKSFCTERNYEEKLGFPSSLIDNILQNIFCPQRFKIATDGITSLGARGMQHFIFNTKELFYNYTFCVV